MRLFHEQERKMKRMHHNIVKLYKELEDVKKEVQHLKRNTIEINHHPNIQLKETTTSIDTQPLSEPTLAKHQPSSIISTQSTSKQTVKERIIEEVQDHQHSLKQLKKIIVDTNKLCSKASFYRYIKELRERKKISQITINNTEFVAGKLIEKK